MSTTDKTALRGGLGVSFCAGRGHFTSVDQHGRTKSASLRADDVSAAITDALDRAGFTPATIGVSYHGNQGDVTLPDSTREGGTTLKLVEPVAASQYGAGIVPLFQGADAAATPLVRATTTASAAGNPTFIKVGPDGQFAWISPGGFIHSMQARVLAPAGTPEYPFLGYTGKQLGAINPFHLIGNAAWARMAEWLISNGVLTDDLTKVMLAQASQAPTAENLRAIASRLIHLAMHSGEESHELGFTIAGHMAAMAARMIRAVISKTVTATQIMVQWNAAAGVDNFGHWLVNPHNTGFMAVLGAGPFPAVDLVHVQKPGALESIGALGMACELVAA